jgi:hypothetical protein
LHAFSRTNPHVQAILQPSSLHLLRVIVPLSVHHVAINYHQAHSDRKTGFYQPLDFFQSQQIL